MCCRGVRCVPWLSLKQLEDLRLILPDLHLHTQRAPSIYFVRAGFLHLVINVGPQISWAMDESRLYFLYGLPLPPPSASSSSKRSVSKLKEFTPPNSHGVFHVGRFSQHISIDSVYRDDTPPQDERHQGVAWNRTVTHFGFFILLLFITGLSSRSRLHTSSAHPVGSHGWIGAATKRFPHWPRG